MATTAPKLSPMQVHLLRFFSERIIDEKETNELKQLIANYYAQKADTLMETIWAEKKYDDASMKDILEKQL